MINGTDINLNHFQGDGSDFRKRDNYRCRQCGIMQKELNYKLNVHHIDFNKKNNFPDNLISLCKICHSQTSFNRQDWTNYFQEKIETFIKD